LAENLKEKEQDWSDEEKATAKYALGNMLGSIAYMYGDRMIFDGNKVILEKPTSLFTGIPDRPNHGRGFMWDEGFHNHLISAWDMDLTEQIISSWFATTDQ
jgi:mannosyl-oligosaccharide glucosidase